MEPKQANLCFHYSEALKSNLFLASSSLQRLTSLKGEKLEGGREVNRAVFEALRSELGIARRHLPPKEIDQLERKLFEVEGEIELHNYGRAQESLGQAFSQVTTLSNQYLQILIKEGLF